MKAITRSQGGALIKKISLKEKSAVCDCCGAKILLQENKQFFPQKESRETYSKFPLSF